MNRRPDLEHLKLTCANTNVPMPYVDIVNEVMEFFVVHGTFDALSERPGPATGQGYRHGDGGRAERQPAIRG